MDIYKITTVGNYEIYYEPNGDEKTITYFPNNDCFLVSTKDIKEIEHMVYQYKRLHNL